MSTRVTTPTQTELRERAREVGARWREHVPTWDMTDECPYEDMARSVIDAGLCGLTMPGEYGGQDLTAMDYVVVVEELVHASQSAAVAEPVFGSTGPGPSMVLRAGHEEVREKFLPAIVAGEAACAIALTEESAGSDLTALRTTAVASDGGFVLNGSKRFITGSPTNELYATFVRFDDVPGYRGIGAIVVEADTPGLRLDRGARFVGTRGLPHGELHFSDCVVPKENLILGGGHFGELMMAFNMERIHNATFSLAMARAAFDEAVAYVSTRSAYGKPIIEFQAAYHALVEMDMDIEAHRLLTYHAAESAVDGRYPQLGPASRAKLSGCTMLPRVTLAAMTLCGGEGTTLDHAAQRLHRDAMAALVAGGSPAVLKNALAAQMFPDHRIRQ